MTVVDPVTDERVGVCPSCGGHKQRRSELCRSCWRQKPKPRSSTRPRTGRQYAREHFPLAAVCERCQNAPAVDRHHINGNPLNNEPGNIASLCRRCHMEVDGRIRTVAT